MNTMYASLSSSLPTPQLPLREIPGTYGLPIIGVVKDRNDFLYNQGINEFFNSRIAKYQSTVFRHNMIPGPPIASDSKVIVLLDAMSFPVLFETDKVDKELNLLGTFTPDLAFFGGFVPLAYQDTSNPFHSKFKSLLLCLSELFSNIEFEIKEKSSSDFNTLNRNMTFNYVFRLCFDKDPADTILKSDGPGIIFTWFALQIAPIVPLGLKYLPHFVEDLLIRTGKLPFLIVKKDYNKVVEVIYDVASKFLDEAEEMGLKRDETCHNLITALFFNGSSGLSVFYPIMFKWIGSAGESVHKRIADEVRDIVAQSEHGTIDLSTLEKMQLVKSVVCEAFRMEPPVPNQFGRAKKDLIVQSHENSFEIKKGELIYGYQPFATNDKKIFGNPEVFVADRFVGEEGEKLLKYVLWSGGRETDGPTPENKQCPGKNMVMLISRLMVAEFFLRYDTFTIEEGSSVIIKSMKKKA
ncbi:hypothetical protein ACHQM5_029397 [Ranunculus cassubicifolius]